ncbi:hypothetical protein AAY42_11315 [Flagellimonas eckloniae]|uniref:DUF3325 domain-containing protein n=1 Tax=Flagellimonas eckloniae TaxID=346185 RepID=A0A0Q1H9N1_9FLAO|nr:hypothetical protein AAY42_11315 [Allomuricauda eckloniae]
MGIVLIFLGCFLLYVKSKHFPEQLNSIKKEANERPLVTRLITYLLFISSAILLSFQLGLATGLLTFLITLLLSLCLTIMLLPLHKKYAYFLAILSLIVIVIENIL